MGKGGRYLKKKERKKMSWLKAFLIAFLIIIVIGVGVGIWFYNHMLNMITRTDPVSTGSTISSEMPDMAEGVELEETGATDMSEETTEGTTSPEDTWPEVVSDENITNIMLVGQAAREGEEALIADSMILCSINRETKTITLTSFLRDLRLKWPEYVDVNGKPHTGNNRINMAYNMGYRWAGDNVKGGMDLLAGIVEYNFGVPVDNTIEVDFDIFMKVVDLLGGVTVEFSQEEIDYMLDNYGSYTKNEKLTVGENWLDGYQALCYARMRKVGNGDYERTERQREVIIDLLNKVKELGILDIYSLYKEVAPLITTDMTNEEITNYAFELIPMLKDLTIQSQRIPFEGMSKSVPVDMGTYIDYQIGCSNVAETGRLLRESIGMTEPEEEE